MWRTELHNSHSSWAESHMGCKYKLQLICTSLQIQVRGETCMCSVSRSSIHPMDIETTDKGEQQIYISKMFWILCMFGKRFHCHRKLWTVLEEHTSKSVSKAKAMERKFWKAKAPIVIKSQCGVVGVPDCSHVHDKRMMKRFTDWFGALAPSPLETTFQTQQSLQSQHTKLNFALQKPALNISHTFQHSSLEFVLFLIKHVFLLKK